MTSQLYSLMKFNIISMALNSELGGRLDDAYVYAWDSDVYPLFHDGARWHQAFEEDFEVTKDMIEELTRRLDDAWDLGRGLAPTFYELEEIYMTRHGGGDWDRGTLISAMRYIALCGNRLDHRFFEQVTRDAGAPAEANGFARPFNRLTDVYLM